MEEIQYIKLDIKFDHILVADLIFFDGPLLSLFENKHGEFYLYYWCDTDNIYNRWLIIRVNNMLIRNYLSRKVTLRELITKPIDGFLYFIDMDDDLDYSQVNLVYPDQLPISYVPHSDSFYSFSKLGNDASIDKFLILTDSVGNVTP